MKAAMVMTGSGPILILTSYDSLENPGLIENLGRRGITKYIARELDLEKVRKTYGTRFSSVLCDLSQSDDLRILDIDGHKVFNSFDYDEMGPPIYH
jgi:hypothetical protein